LYIVYTIVKRNWPFLSQINLNGTVVIYTFRNMKVRPRNDHEGPEGE